MNKEIDNRIIKFIRDLDWYQWQYLEIPKDQTIKFSQQLSEEFDFQGLHGLFKYLLNKESLKPNKSLISLLYMFVEPKMPSENFLQFWAIYKILLIKLIQKFDSQGYSKLIKSIKQIYLLLIKFIEDTVDCQINQWKKVLQKELFQYLAILLSANGQQKKDLKKIASQLIESIITNKKSLDLFELFFTQSLQLEKYDQNPSPQDWQRQYKIHFIILQTRTKIFFIIKILEILFKDLSKKILMSQLTNKIIIQLFNILQNIILKKILRSRQNNKKYIYQTYLLRSPLLNDILEVIKFLFIAIQSCTNYWNIIQLKFQNIKKQIITILSNSQLQDKYPIYLKIVSLTQRNNKNIIQSQKLFILETFNPKQIINPNLLQIISQKDKKKLMDEIVESKFFKFNDIEQIIILFELANNYQIQFIKKINKLSYKNLNKLIKIIIVNFSTILPYKFKELLHRTLIGKLLTAQFSLIKIDEDQLIQFLIFLKWVKILSLSSLQKQVAYCQYCSTYIYLEIICRNCNGIPRIIYWQCSKIYQIGKSLEKAYQHINEMCSQAQLLPEKNFKEKITKFIVLSTFQGFLMPQICTFY